MPPIKEFKGFREIIAANDALYRSLLGNVANDSPCKAFLEKYDRPNYDNGFWPLIDCISMLAVFKECQPKTFVELGAGWSTHWARACSDFLGLDTHIVSIDPETLSGKDVTGVSNEHHARGAQDLSLEWYAEKMADPSTILSIDTMHVCHQETEVPFIYLELLPSVKHGRWVHIHDQFLPWDYPQEWNWRKYNETYLVALMLQGKNWEARLASYYAIMEPNVNQVFEPLWKDSPLGSIPRDGGSLWLECVS